MQWVKQSASKLEWAKLPLAYTTHILFHVISTYTFRSSQSHQQNGNEALKLWRSKQDSWIHSTSLLQHFLFLQSQHLMVSFLEYFLTIYSEHKLSAVHLQNSCSFEEPSHSNPKSKIHSTSTTSAHLLSWVCVQGFGGRGLQGWLLWEAAGSSPPCVTEAGPISSKMDLLLAKAKQCHWQWQHLWDYVFRNRKKTNLHNCSQREEWGYLRSLWI